LAHIAAHAKLEDEVDIVVIFERAVHFGDGGVIDFRMQRNLLPHARFHIFGAHFIFADDLDGTR
jgi:hypothetical protein